MLSPQSERPDEGERSGRPAEPAPAEHTLPGSAAVLGPADPMGGQGWNQRAGDKPCPFPSHPFAAHYPPPLSSNRRRLSFSLRFAYNETDEGKKPLLVCSLVMDQIVIQKQNKNNCIYFRIYFFLQQLCGLPCPETH